MKAYRQLTINQRYQIKAFLEIELSYSQIATKVGVSKSTIYREINRLKNRRDYDPLIAHNLAKQKKKIPRRKSKLTLKIKNIINEKLYIQWSPEQISGYMKRNGFQLSFVRIYQYIETDKINAGALYQNLRHSNKKRKKKYGSKDKRGQIKNRVSIDLRPLEVEAKSRIGDWEADLIIGKNHKGAFVTLVERVSKFTLLGFVESKKASLVSKEIIRLLTPYKKHALTITFDNGKEFEFHEKIDKELDTKSYFAHPYSSWERGLNENANGLIRQYFPKKSSFVNIEPNEIYSVSAKLNSRPRKTLGFLTPNDMFYKMWLQEGV